jgi:hypothetical protein
MIASLYNARGPQDAKPFKGGMSQVAIVLL